jgi:lipopolysaccharide transport system ATP-binding protein
MGLRLGFAVAAHLEPDILIVDEVLAVGDAEFQKKCIGKMSEVAGEGRTVLFVSHNMAAISQLCPRSILLKNGSNFKDDSTERVIKSYFDQNADIIADAKDLASIHRNRTTYKPMLQRIGLKSEGQFTTKFVTFGELTVEVECSLFSEGMKTASLGIVITNALGTRVLVSHFDQYGYCKVDGAKTLVFVATISSLVLAPGSYRISLHLSDGVNDIDMLENAIGFDVEWNSKIRVKYPPRTSWGDIFVDFNWSVSQN